MKINKLNLFFFLILFAVVQSGSYAQCAMCKTTVESDLNTGGSIGTSLNTGILYLMALPYVVIISGGYFFFRKQINAKVKDWKNKFFPRQVR